MRYFSCCISTDGGVGVGGEGCSLILHDHTDDSHNDNQVTFMASPLAGSGFTLARIFTTVRENEKAVL